MKRSWYPDETNTPEKRQIRFFSSIFSPSFSKNRYPKATDTVVFTAFLLSISRYSIIYFHRVNNVSLTVAPSCFIFARITNKQNTATQKTCHRKPIIKIYISKVKRCSPVPQGICAKPLCAVIQRSTRKTLSNRLPCREPTGSQRL